MYLAARSDTTEPAAIDGVLDAGGSAALRHGQRRFRCPDPRRPGIRHARLDRSGGDGGADGHRHRRARRDHQLELPVGAGQDQERVLRLLDRGEDDAAGSADVRRAAGPQQGTATSSGCATSPRSSSPPPRPTYASSSTAATASSSASSRRRRPTRSTSRPACARSCRRSRPTSRRACRSPSSTIRRRRSARRSSRCSRRSARRRRSSSSSSSFSSVRSARSSVPIVTIPLSLVGVCFLMWAIGYSLNTLTLLAMVLAIGLVVDDAIVVVENIHRHLEEGYTPLSAAIQGHARADPGGHRHDHHARRGVRADRLHHRHHRLALPRIRADARRRRADLGLRRAHRVADDVGAAPHAGGGRFQRIVDRVFEAIGNWYASGGSPARCACGR